MTTPQVERVGPWLLALWVGWAAAVAPVQASTQRLTQISFVCDADGHPVLEREIRVDPDTGEQSVQERRLLIDPLHPSGLSQVVACESEGGVSTVQLSGVHPLAQLTWPASEDPGTIYLLNDSRGSTRAAFVSRAAAEPTNDLWERQNYDAFGVSLDAGAVKAPGNARGEEPSFAGLEHGFRGELFFAELGFVDLRARWYDPESGRFHTGDFFEGEHEDPSSLHRFTYSADDPVNRVDPSGYFTLLEMDLVQKVQTTIRNIEAQSPRAAVQAAKAKTWDVYLGVRIKPFSRTPLHSTLFVENLVTREGARYEVGIVGDKPLLRTSVGGIRRRLGSLAAFKRHSTWHFKVARLNTLQYLGWDRAIGFLEADDSIIPIDYSVFGFAIVGRGPSNCMAWSLEAALAAWAASKVAN